MQSIKRALILISLSVIFLMLGSTYFTTFVSLKLASASISESIIGMIHTAYSIGFVIGTLKTEKLIEKLGHTRSFIFFAIIFSLSTLGSKFFPSLVGWFTLRLVSGMCLAALYVVLESFYLLISPANKRGKILAIYMIALYVSQSVSQFFYTIIPFESEAIFLILSFLIFFSCVPMIRLENPEIPQETSKLSTVLKNPSISWLGLHVSFVSGVVLTALYSFLPLLAQKLNLSIPSSMSLMILGGLLFQWPIGLLSDRTNRKILLLTICLLTFFPTIFPFIYPVSTSMNYLLIILIGGMSFSLYPIAMALLCENKPKEELTALTGLLVLLYSFGMIFGPMLTPFFNMLNDHYGLYLQIIVFSTLLGIHTLTSLIKSYKKAHSKQSINVEN